GGSAGVGVGGKGGAVTVNAGTLRLLGADGSGNSINSSGGSGAAAGAITINTYGTQALPFDFDLTNNAVNTIALAGGFFNVGNPSYNGSLGNITANAAQANPGNSFRVVAGSPFSAGGINIVATGSSFTIRIGGVPTLISSDDGFSNRT